MTANLSATADPKIKDIITSLDDDKIGKVSYLPSYKQICGFLF